jgi:hypothetical protein
MLGAESALLPRDRIAIQAFGPSQITHALRHHGQVMEMRGDPRMIVAQHAAIDGQCSFISLFGQSPLLLKFGVRSLREVNFPHTADTQGAQYTVWSDAISHHR